MIILFIVGLACIAIAAMKLAEGVSLSLIVYAAVGVAGVIAYLVSFIRKKMEK